MNYKLTIGWLFPELMSTYGDRGNIICIQKRCEWRGINIEILKLDLGLKIDDLRSCDFLFMGGAQDLQQKIVSEDLRKKREILKEMIEDNVPGLYICGAYQLLGKYYKEADGTIIEGLGILDLYTENPGENSKRLIGNIVIESGIMNHELRQNTLVGFENHGGRTYLGKNIRLLGKVIKGFGNNGEDKTEGAIYKNSFGSYLHGPILPKNPHFADYLISLSLKEKYKKSVPLSPLDDSLEWAAHKAIAKRLGISI
ncbi:MAG: cobalamin biosynthesis protein CobQ [Candidatus Levybacteria bacterium]|nr:cobalamin biosynthesis protein CobQ [Candidatus Levybacteria bacterium]